LSLDYQEQDGKMYFRDGAAIGKKEVEVEKGEPLKLELQAFVEAVTGRSAPAVTAQQGAAALEVALEITRLIHAAAPA
ncbi:MAG: gfo/Idh/MocA family oxidoreductase, partial [Akkermansiaceae bacterium]|nr:gfo/Idh/MocA family oxidoreductase [Akkermansiaceae bacterium]